MYTLMRWFLVPHAIVNYYYSCSEGYVYTRTICVCASVYVFASVREHNVCLMHVFVFSIIILYLRLHPILLVPIAQYPNDARHFFGLSLGTGS